MNQTVSILNGGGSQRLPMLELGLMEQWDLTAKEVIIGKTILVNREQLSEKEFRGKGGKRCH